jgi:hypothetical protein
MQGRVDGSIKYRWYPSGWQLFARHTVPTDHYAFTIESSKIELVDLIDLLADKGFGD